MLPARRDSSSGGNGISNRANTSPVRLPSLPVPCRCRRWPDRWKNRCSEWPAAFSAGSMCSGLVSASIIVCVGRTLLSAALDLGVDFDLRRAANNQNQKQRQNQNQRQNRSQNQSQNQSQRQRTGVSALHERTKVNALHVQPSLTAPMVSTLNS